MFSISLQGFQKSLWHVIVSLYKVLAWTRKCYLKCGEVINQYILNWNIIVWVFLVCLPHVGRFLLAALSHRMRQMHLIAYAWSVTEMFYVCQHEISQFSSLFFLYDAHAKCWLCMKCGTVERKWMDPVCVLFSDKTWLHVSRSLHIHNNRYWSAENTMLNHQVPIYDVIVVIWCAMSASVNLGTLFFFFSYYGTINSHHCPAYQAHELCCHLWPSTLQWYLG
jgi:hypothetical protein